MTNKVLSVNGTQYLIPVSMSERELQQVAGLLITMKTVTTEYLWNESGYASYAGDGLEIRIKDVELMTKAEALAKSEEGRKVYQAKQDAQKSID
jgi:hypothetical protein